MNGGLRPIHGDKVTCDMCGVRYTFFVWSFGSDRCLCHKCVHKRPQAVLDGLDDGIDLVKEFDMIHKEHDEMDRMR
ncbi:hypothetical protein LCGC14_1961360 [marine sediment metagenome]|uniref:Uncharacterized protein n=1 Tax=marine sediment metagenome TaxID=412755 RepID=A0A0F9HSX3_9ZZZZ